MVRRRLFVTSLLLVILVAPPQAQAPAVSGAAPGRSANNAPAAAKTDVVELLVGRSTVLNLDAPIARVSLTTPDVADAMVTAPYQLLIHGKAPGTISLFVWDRSGGIKTYEVSVKRDLTTLTEQVGQLFPGEAITVSSTGKDVVLSGTVSTPYVIEKAASVAAGYVGKKDDVVNLLRQQEGVASNQVMLRVRFAEVSRSALQELGAAFFTGPSGSHDWLGRSTTQQFAAPIFDEGNGRPKLVFSDFLNLFLFNKEQQLGTLVKALTTRGLFQSLAEPNLVTQNGKEASFLAGGEYPYPAVQGGLSGLAISIVFKEFGIRLNFTPTILGADLIHLKVRPEVSSLDFTNAVSFQGFRIPALSTRRADTEVELRDGQTFAIAGLLNNTVTSSMQKIPGIGDIPILGLLFRSRALQKGQTELVVMITPQIIRRDSTGVTPALPRIEKPFIVPPKNTLPPPPPYAPKSGDAAAAAPRPPSAPARPAGDAYIWGSQPLTVPDAPPASPTVPAVSQAPQPASPTVPAASQAPQPASPMVPPKNQAPQPASQAARPSSQAAQLPATVAPMPRDPKTSEADRRRQRAEAKLREQDERKAASEAKARAEQQRRDEDSARRRAEADRKKAEKQAEEDRRAQEKRDAAEARRRAEQDRRAAEAAQKQAEDDRERGKALAEAQARLKAAQAEVDRIKRQP